jgi:hypothetical protein
LFILFVNSSALVRFEISSGRCYQQKATHDHSSFQDRARQQLSKEGYVMTTRLIEIPYNELHPTIRALSDAGMTDEDAAWLRRSNNSSLAVRLMRHHRRFFADNPHKLSEVQIFDRLMRANQRSEFGFSQAQITELMEAMPAWPKGEWMFLVPRIRMGQENEGVYETAKKHLDEIRATHYPHWIWDMIKLESGHFWLQVGDKSHQPCLEWITCDMSPDFMRETETAFDSPRALADEALVFTWLYSEFMGAKSVSGQRSELIVCGYRAKVGCVDEEQTQRVLRIYQESGRVGDLCVLGLKDDHGLWEPLSIPIEILDRESMVAYPTK